MVGAKHSPLVSGALPAQGTRALAWVRVLRPFYYGGVVIDAGTERQLDAVFVAELVTARKAERIDPPAPKPAAPAPAPAKTKD